MERHPSVGRSCAGGWLPCSSQSPEARQGTVAEGRGLLGVRRVCVCVYVSAWSATATERWRPGPERVSG